MSAVRTERRKKGEEPASQLASLYAYSDVSGVVTEYQAEQFIDYFASVGIGSFIMVFALL